MKGVEDPRARAEPNSSETAMSNIGTGNPTEVPSILFLERSIGSYVALGCHIGTIRNEINQDGELILPTFRSVHGAVMWGKIEARDVSKESNAATAVKGRDGLSSEFSELKMSRKGAKNALLMEKECEKECCKLTEL